MIINNYRPMKLLSGAKDPYLQWFISSPSLKAGAMKAIPPFGALAPQHPIFLRREKTFSCNWGWRCRIFLRY